MTNTPESPTSPPSPTQHLIEPVARAICRASGADPDQPLYRDGNPASAVLYLKWKVYREEAEAAIKACRVVEMVVSLKTLMTELSWCARQLGCDWKDGEWRDRSSVGRAYSHAETLLARLDKPAEQPETADSGDGP